MGCRLKAIICQIGLRHMYCELRRFSMSSSLGLEVKVNSGIGDCLVREFDSINGIYRIGRWRRESYRHE